MPPTNPTAAVEEDSHDNDEIEIDLFSPQTEPGSLDSLEQWLEREEVEEGEGVGERRVIRRQYCCTCNSPFEISCSSIKDGTGHDKRTCRRCIRAPNKLAVLVVEAFALLAAVGLFVFSFVDGNFKPAISCTTNSGDETICLFDRGTVCNDGEQLSLLSLSAGRSVRTPYSFAGRADDTIQTVIVCGFAATPQAVRILVALCASLFSVLSFHDIRKSNERFHNVHCTHLFFSAAFAAAFFVTMCVDAHAMLGGASFCDDTLSPFLSAMASSSSGSSGGGSSSNGESNGSGRGGVAMKQSSCTDVFHAGCVLFDLGVAMIWVSVIKRQRESEREQHLSILQ